MVRRSPVFAQAIQTWHAIRAEYEIVKGAAYERAEIECSGVLLNARGKHAGVDPYSLFSGPLVRALAYASPELVEHWARYPRLTFEAFERQIFRAEEGVA